MLLADEGTEDVPVEVPAEQVCMHFFPGSRVDVKGTPPQQVGSSPTVSPAISEYLQCGCLSFCSSEGTFRAGHTAACFLVKQLSIASTA